MNRNDEEEIVRLRISTILIGKMIKEKRRRRKRRKETEDNREKTTVKRQETGARKDKAWFNCSSLTTRYMNE